MQPRAEIGAGLESSELPVRLQERFLNDVLGVLRVAGHAMRQTEDGAAVALHEAPEGFAVTIAGERDSGGVRMRHPSD